MLAVVPLGCAQPEDSLSFAEATGTTLIPDETETEEGGESETTGEDPGPYEGLRFIASGSNPAVLLALDLDTPHSIPDAETIVTGMGQAGLFGPTPWGSHVVTHDGMIDQLRLSADGEFSLSSLAVLPGNWLHSVWFNDAGTNALMAVADDPIAPPNQLFFLRYDDEILDGTLNITPPLDDNGTVIILGRSPDDIHLVVLVDAEMDGTWQIYELIVEPEPSEANPAVLVDQAILPGIPAQNVAGFLWAHVDDQRVVYRKELLPNILRPVAVPLDDPEANPTNLAPTLGHVSSMVFNDSDTAMLVGHEGGSGYRQLAYIHLDGAVEARDPITLTEPDAPALHNVLPPLGALVQGHGFDARDRIWLGYSQTGDKTDNISLITHFEGGVMDRADLVTLPPDGAVERIRFDPATQLLAYRVVTGVSSWIAYVDLSAEVPEEIRLDQFYDHDPLAPEDHAGFGWSADKSTIAVAGVQNGVEVVHVAALGDIDGTTLALEPADVEDTEGVAIEHAPLLSPDGEQILLWYAATNDRRGVLQIPTDGEGLSQAVVNLQYTLNEGAFMP